MTLYILAGGSDRSYPHFGPALANLIRQSVVQPKVLDVFFAVEDALQDEKYQEWEDWYNTHFGPGISRQLALYESFETQVTWADVIYLHGGETVRIIEALKSYSDKKLKDMFGGKIVVGSSAGTNFLTVGSYSPRAAAEKAGRGLVSVTAVVHYGATDMDGVSYTTEKWREIASIVKKGNPSLPLLLLPEGTFTAIEL
jgi:peptidase E